MSTGDSEGPAWNKFWMSFDHESESMVSGEGGSRLAHSQDPRSLMSPDLVRPGMERLESVAPADSASHNGRDSPDQSAITGATGAFFEDNPFVFKFKAPSGRMHRLHVLASAGMPELIASVAEKLGSEADAIGGVPVFEDGKIGHAGFALSYLDNEGDSISITTDQDLVEAISLARLVHRDKVDLFVHDPDSSPMPATTAPQPVVQITTPPESSVRSRRGHDDEEDEADFSERKRARPASAHGKSEEQQLIGGVPNELLLPGAIVTLAVVIIGVFAISRASSRS